MAGQDQERSVVEEESTVQNTLIIIHHSQPHPHSPLVAGPHNPQIHPSLHLAGGHLVVMLDAVGGDVQGGDEM